MPRSGGPSTATGVSYQALAVALRAVDVHLGRITSLRPEAPPVASFGLALIDVSVDDYIIVREGRRTYYQAKSNAPGGGNWTVNKLCSEEVLQDFIAQARNDAAAICRLLTPSPCELLGEISERARSAASFDEFRTNLSAVLLKDFQDFCGHEKVKISEADGFELIKRFGLEQRSLESLIEELERLTTVTFVDAKGALESLFFLATSWMRSGQEVTSALLRDEFSRRAVYNKPTATPDELARMVADATARMAEGRIDIKGVHIIQPAVTSVLNWAGSPTTLDKPIAAFLDQAGSGKSVAMSVLCKRLRLLGYEVLGIRLDGLHFSTAEELQRALLLPAPVPSVIQALKAAKKKVAVLIDQLDALALSYAHQPAAASTIMDLAARLARIGGVPVVVACRSFDWDYSHLISEFKDKAALKETLPELTEDQVKTVLPAFGLNAGQLHQDTIQVVRSPYRLKLLVDIVEEHRKTDPAWVPPLDKTSSLQALLEEFWQLKLRRAESEGRLSADCVRLVQTIEDYLSANETLTAPLALLDDYRGAADWLHSNGVLVATAAGVSFFHQTFFDFIFARQFLVRQGSIADFLLSTDQSLFYRSLTRQALTHVRGSDRRRYLKEVAELLSKAGIREHLRWLVVSNVGQSVQPSQEEFALLETAFLSEQNFIRTASYWNGNPGWLDTLGLARFTPWLDLAKPNVFEGALRYLASILSVRQREVVGLLEPYVGKDSQWNAIVARTLTGLEKRWAPPTVALLKKILKDPNTDLSFEHGWWWMAFLDLSKALPEEACALLPDILERHTPLWPKDISTDPDEADKLLPKVYEFTEALNILATRAPKALLESTLDWTLARMEATCTADSPQLYKTNHSIWRIERDIVDEPPTQLLAAIRKAACELAAADADSIRPFLTKVVRTEHEPLHCIAAKVFALNPTQFSSEAAEYLGADARRLRLGTTGNHLWHSVKLTEACSALWSSEETARIEASILNLTPLVKPRSVRDLRWQGTDKLQLLSALVPEKMTANGRKVLGELQRKFPQFKTPSPDSFSGGMVGPPIPQERLEKLSDAGWIGAMRKYKDEEPPDADFFSLRGGRAELAHAMQAVVEKAPARFLALAKDRMDTSFHPVYYRAIINGLAKGKVAISDLTPIIEKFVPIMPSEELHWVASAIADYSRGEIPEPLIVLIRDWALHSPFPTAEEESPLKSDRKRYTELLTQGLNNTRGGSLWALGNILLKSTPPKFDEFFAVAEEVTKDPAPSVRAICLNFLASAIHSNPARGHSIYARLVAGHPELLGEIETQQCIYRCLHRNANDVLADIEALMHNEDAEVREAGARLACLAAFETERAHPLRDKCIGGAPEFRKGAATVYSANIGDATVGAESRGRLYPLLNDPEEAVRDKAAGFLRRLSPRKLVELEEPVIKWANSKSIVEGSGDISYVLNKHPVANPGLTLTVTEKTLDALGAEVTNIQKRHGMISHQLIPALLNVYRHGVDATTRKKALDLFERFEALGTGEVAKAYASYDRT